MNEENKLSLKEEAHRYESAAKTWLMKKVPVFVRVNVKACKTFTNGFRKPFDPIMTKTMQQTLKKLCEEAQGCVFGYTVSDEIILVLTDYHKWNSVPWLDYEVQKVCSAAASTATIAFNKLFNKNKEQFYRDYDGIDKEALYAAYNNASEIGAQFITSCFNVPEHRVCEMIYWRQLDARRNSIQALGRKYLTRKEIVGKCNDEVIDMLIEKHHVYWQNMPTEFRIGSSCTKGANPFSQKKKWCIDRHMPLLDEDGRTYLQKIMDSIRIDDDYNGE